MSDLEKHLDQLLELAKSAWHDERFAAAAELLSPYLRHRNDKGYPWFLYGDSLRALGLFSESERALSRAHELAPKKPWPIVRLACVRRECGDHDGAEKFFAQVSEDPEVAEMGWYWIFRGANFAVLNQLEKAEKCHRQALTLADGDHDEAWLNIGYVLRAGGKYAKAIEAFNKALEITPDYDEAKEGLEGLRGIDDAIALAKATRPPAEH